MATTVLEQTRAGHEEAEHLERLIVKDFRNELKGHKERLHQSHRVRNMLDIMQEQAKKLADIYQDEDDSRKDDIASLKVDQGDFKVFYDRVRDLKDYYRNRPIEVTEAENDELASREEPRVEFSGEEGQGRFLDLHEHYHTFINSKFGHSKEEAPKEYQDYVTSVTDFSQISRQHRMSRPYREYLQGLLGYLEQFYERTSPLGSLTKVYSKLEGEFDTAFEEGQVPGWEDRGGGKLPGDQGNAMDLQAFDTVDELESLGADALKDALTKLGLKCGGTLRQRAERLILTKTTPVEKLDRKLFAKGVVPAAARDSEQASKQKAAAREAALLECKTRLLLQDKDLLGKVVTDTVGNIEKKQARTYEELQAEQMEAEEEAAASDSDEEDDFIYNPLKLPLGWDGKPIPYWLYKLHGLNQEFQCEICGGATYWGRRAFERHFREYRHQASMRVLGIPNTKNFYEITKVADAQKLWKNIQDREKPGHKIEVDEEYEDAEGNVYNRKTYEDLRRQGLI
ncbi:hypothetical protein WJX82_004178 [Trebouxia sp. C0006]